MSSQAKMELIMLMSHEIRIAGRLLKEARDLCVSEGNDSKLVQNAFNRAYTACDVALHHVTGEPGQTLMLLETKHIPLKGEYAEVYNADKEAES